MPSLPSLAPKAAWTRAIRFPATAGEPSFTAAIRHIHAVLAGAEEPRLLAVDTALSTARGLHDLAESYTARAGPS